jgi:N-carbamoyl-L-amino-acid hydrolase
MTFDQMWSAIAPIGRDGASGGYRRFAWSRAAIPTAMLFVRNPTGVSHSPEEHAETADCLVGVAALADALAELAGEGT